VEQAVTGTVRAPVEVDGGDRVTGELLFSRQLTQKNKTFEAGCAEEFDPGAAPFGTD
jgi:hypothetical protein